MEDKPKFERVTADDNSDYYCPLGVAGGRSRPKVERLGDCIEADVVGRYSGHLDIVQ